MASAESLPNLRRCANELCCEAGEGALKATVLDTLPIRHTYAAAALFFFCVFLTLIIGGTGPAVASLRPFVVTAPGLGASPTAAQTLTFTLDGLSKWQQATWLLAGIQRPVVAPGGAYLQASSPLTLPVAWTLVAVTADGVRTVYNSSHVTSVFCPPRQATCAPFALFSQALRTVERYDIEVALTNPYGSIPGLPAQDVVLNMSQGTVNPLYTQFGA